MELNYERRGAGEPLLLIHGLGGSSRIWAPVLDRLAAHRDTIAIDLPGAGRSPVLDAGVASTPANFGLAISDLCNRLGIERPHVAGNSLGGWVALEMAKAGDAASVCALSPAGLWRRPLGPRRFDIHGLGRSIRPLVGLALRSAQVRERLLATTMAHPERLTEDEARGLIEDWIDAPGYEAANREMRSHVFADPQLVTVPATIAWASEDRLVAAPRPDRIPPGARYVVLEGLGHTPTWDDPQRITTLLLEASGAAAKPEVAAQSS
jgi:pimeloyl-ACP methyl ester carboxylesterase